MLLIKDCTVGHAAGHKARGGVTDLIEVIALKSQEGAGASLGNPTFETHPFC